jgi:hypothetical protein
MYEVQKNICFIKNWDSDAQRFNWQIWRKKTTWKIYVQTYVPVGR